MRETQRAQKGQERRTEREGGREVGYTKVVERTGRGNGREQSARASDMGGPGRKLECAYLFNVSDFLVPAFF
jgi:hypothetical protein